MEEEILKLIYNYSVNKKYADQEFYNTILVLFLKHHKVNNYINTIIINNDITDLGIYDNKRKTIIINNLEILNSSDNKIELLSLRDIDEYFLINIEASITILHELEHVYQNMIIDGQVTTLEDKLIYYGLAFCNSRVLYNFFGTKYTKEELDYLYNTTYDYNPSERLADINSYNIIYNTINNEKKINPRIKDLIKYEYESLKLIGYKDIGSIIECPSYLYLKKINKLNSKTDISFKTTKYQLEDRLRLGIEISYDEYQRVTKYHKELKRKLV